MHNRFAGLSKCVCKTPSVSKHLEGICTVCFGRVPLDKPSRAHTPVLNPFITSDIQTDRPETMSKISLKLNHVSRSSSNLLENVHHKRSNTSNLSKNTVNSHRLNGFQGSYELLSGDQPINPRYLNQPHKKNQIINLADQKYLNQPHTNSQVFVKNDANQASCNFASPHNDIKSSSNALYSIFHPSKSTSTQFNPIPSEHISSDFRGQSKHDRAMSSRLYMQNQIYVPPSQLAGKTFSSSLPFTEILHKGHRNSVNSVAFMQNKTFTCSSDYKVIAWPRLGAKVASKQQEVAPIGTFKGHSRRVLALESISPSFLISAGDEKKIRIWNTNSDFKPVGHLKTLASPIRSLCYIADESFVCAMSNIDIWDLRKKCIIHSFILPSHPILCIEKLSSYTFISGSTQGQAMLFDLRTTRPISSFQHSSSITSLLQWDDCTFYSAADTLCVSYT